MNLYQNFEGYFKYNKSKFGCFYISESGGDIFIVQMFEKKEVFDE